MKHIYISAPARLIRGLILLVSPKEVKDEDGRVYLDIVRPKNLYQGKIVANIF